MKIIHTSDWHLGKKLYGRGRYEESEKFLDWLLETIKEECADALLISGDVFDTVSPSNKALEQYYGFLYRVSTSCCRDIIITAGNHDSPSLLNAPKELLKRLNVHIIGNPTENPEDEIIVIKDFSEKPGAIVCAVPYLREKDIRINLEGESPDEKSLAMLEGIRDHYARISACAEGIRDSYGKDRLPLIAMGHLFVAGGVTVSGDGVREIYIGNLERVGTDIFPKDTDYIALGHLHVPQKIAGCVNKRYSGSPLPIGFAEADQKKIVILIEFTGSTTEIKEINVPVFRQLKSIRGDLDEIKEQILGLKFNEGEVWAEVVYTGAAVHGELREIISDIAKDSNVDLLRIKNESLSSGILRSMEKGESLSDLSEYDVFERCMESAGVDCEQRAELKETFKEALTILFEEDCSAE
ncbi:MAG: exonuclease SbcCD subunit D C-terminal domain-containing protein [Methanomicrobiaceae archaeon]|nr:exonuclease SbcCD subunit D C-terminal domain-containing protein [Methanomicrobiaceae archaeon]